MRGTDYLEITAKHPSEKEAARLANAVAEAFIERRQQIENKRSQQALETLDEEIQLQVEVVAKLKAETGEFLKESDIHQAEDMLREMMHKHQDVRTLLKVARHPITIFERAR